MDDDALNKLLRAGADADLPQRQARARPSRLPPVILAIFAAICVGIPLIMLITNDPTAMIAGIAAGDPLSLLIGLQ